jgi:5-methylcytosine-specific restriction protein A
MPLRSPLHRSEAWTPSAAGFRRESNASSASRGYGEDWRRLRLQVLADEALCRMCQTAGRVTAATEVHHMRGFHGIHDPLRLDRRWLMPICVPCHRRESQRDGVDARR